MFYRVSSWLYDQNLWKIPLKKFNFSKVADVQPATLIRTRHFSQQGWTNLLLHARFFGRPSLFARPIGHEKKKKNGLAKLNSMCTSYRETTRSNIFFLLCYLNRACSFHFDSNFIKSFCNEAFAARVLFECLKQDTFQKVILILQTHPSKGIQKYMLKAWHFNKYKIRHKFFDNNWQKNCQKNSLESDNAHILLIAVLMVS